jgi:hypothetical protein
MILPRESPSRNHRLALSAFRVMAKIASAYANPPT